MGEALCGPTSGTAAQVELASFPGSRLIKCVGAEESLAGIHCSAVH